MPSQPDKVPVPHRRMTAKAPPHIDREKPATGWVRTRPVDVKQQIGSDVPYRTPAQICLENRPGMQRRTEPRCPRKAPTAVPNGPTAARRCPGRADAHQAVRRDQRSRDHRSRERRPLDLLRPLPRQGRPALREHPAHGGQPRDRPARRDQHADAQSRAVSSCFLGPWPVPVDLAHGRHLNLFLDGLQSELVALFVDRLEARIPAGTRTAVPPPLLAAMIAGMLITAVRTWVESDLTGSAEEVNRSFIIAAEAALRGGARPTQHSIAPNPTITRPGAHREIMPHQLIGPVQLYKQNLKNQFFVSRSYPFMLRQKISSWRLRGPREVRDCAALSSTRWRWLLRVRDG